MTTYNVSAGITSSGLILSAGDELMIEPGGTTIDITVSSGGFEYVSSGGGTTIGTIISSGGVEEVCWASIASATIITDGGKQLVDLMGTTSGTVISSGGVEEVSAGIATGTVVMSGGTLIDYGGNVSSATIDNGGTLIVTPGGSVSYTSDVGAVVISADIIVRSSGVLVSTLDSTLLSDFAVPSGEVLQVYSGGTVDGAVIGSGGKLALSGGTASGAVISSGGIEYVSYGGVASGTIVSSGASEVVSYGGVASDTVVSSGASEVVSYGGHASDTVVSSGGVQYVSHGGFASGTTVSSGAEELVLTHGYAFGTVVNSGGVERVSSGFTSRTIVSSGGAEVVLTEGKASGTIVSSGGTETVSSGGITSDTIVSAGGTESISSGGYAIDTTIYASATEYVSGGGSASGTTVNSGGGLYVAGTVSDTIISSGGTEYLFDNAVASDTIVSAGGIEDLLDGGITYGTIVSSGGREYVSDGGAADTIISSGGQAFISAIGAASGTIISSGGDLVLIGGELISGVVESGGTLVITPGGSATYTSSVGATVISASMLVESGGALVSAIGSSSLSSFAVATGDVLQVYSGGTTDNTVIGSGGEEQVQSGGTADGTVISSGGHELVSFDGITSGTAIKSGALLTLTDVGNDVASGIVFEQGGQIDLLNVGYSSDETSVSYANSVLTVTADGTTTTLSLTGDYTGEYFALSNDGHGDTLITAEGTPCYCRGTRIATERGDVAVENLTIGDRLLTISGAMRPIRWIGRRSYAGQFAATNPAVLPVMFRAGSLGDAVPARDLMVSPLHAMYLDGVLIPAEALVNGVSILRMENVDRVDYFHLELDTHDVILAEGAASETFVDDGSRGMFHNAVEYRALYPDAVRTEARYCAPRVEDGEELAAINRALVLRATGGEHPVNAGPLSGFVDVVESGRIAGWAFHETTPEAPVKLRVLDGEHVLAEIFSDIYRTDLAGAGIGNGHNAFEFIVPGGLSPNSRHIIRVVRAEDGQDLKGSPWVIEADPSLSPTVLVRPNGPVADHGQGFLDHTSRQRIAGWAYDSTHGSEPVTVQIFDNGQCIAQTLANTYRADLAAAGYEGGRFGFDILLPGGLSPMSRHIIQVCRAHDGAELMGSPIVIEAADSFDADLAESVTRAVDGLAVGHDRERVLSFLLSQAERLRQHQANEASGREAQDRRRRLIRRSGGMLVDTHDGPETPVRRALIIDEQLPDTTRDAGSCAILSHMRGLQALGYDVSFAAASEMEAPHGAAIRASLLSEGITCWHAPFYASVEDVLRKQARGFDLVYLHRVNNASRYMALTRQHQQSARVLYSVADLHHVRLERQATLEGRPELLTEARKLRLAECAAAWQADAVITHSSEEAAILRRLVPTAVVHQVPWSIDLRTDAKQPIERQGVLFLGHYGHAPNVDAAQWLVREIMPHVWAKRPDIKCILAGSAMPEAVRRLASESVEISGYVSELKTLFNRVVLSVAPLRFGAGVKGKVLDSLANGVPCVMSDIAAEGMMLPIELLTLQTTTDANAIARQILQLHENRAEYEQLRQAGLAMIQNHHGRKNVISGLRAAVGVDHLPVALTGRAG
ncbi:Hint domain-containing protein [Gluconobacter sphaericus]|uniref:Hint domain-containing protein n=1 Tax=Gluconobacter sphaericus TaxID=574987 RepID=UPI001B8BC371|nr:Hint domain-containing protein [Gluconobacter sphaericus]MBS1086799.1 Hint domain-containing protein [Gluconobacter sphaericus]MBS1100650.1 Hint domain-containing protein [Gluconobacter sphaericus]